MPADPNPTRTHAPDAPPTASFDPALDAGLAAAFGPDDLTPGGWSQPPLLRDDSSGHAPLVQPSSPEMPRGPTDRYQLLGEIARGGMGVVLKGRDPDLGRDLAFKVLRSELAHRPAAVQRFVEEAQVGGQLQHPGVVPVYDLGRFADGRPYFAMKLVKGRTLADLLAERPDPSAERGRFLHIFLQVCQTIAYAHKHGVIHRDLKPSNVMVGDYGEVLVMDWGLAKVLPRGGIADEIKATQASRERERPEEDFTEIKTVRFGTGSETAAGSILGTPAFMPPEQAGGEIDKLDERADVFGLGAMLCVVLTGKPPYLAKDADSVRLMAIRGELADAFARLDGCGADPELIGLCKRFLAADREQRPRHAGEVTTALSAYLVGVEERAHKAEIERAAAAAEAREQHKRRRVQLALVAAVLLLAAGGGAFAWLQDKQTSRRNAVALQRQLEDERIASEKRERETRNRDAFVASLERCEDALRADNADTAAPALAEVERRLPEGGTEGFAARVDRCRVDLAMLHELVRIDGFRWTWGEGNFPDPWAVMARWQRAFAGFGVVPGTTTPTEATRRLGESLIRERLLGALDLWLVAGGPAELAEILAVADPDAYRDAVRVAVRLRHGWLVQVLAVHDAALRQPARFAIALGDNGAIPVVLQRAVLRQAMGSRQGNLSILMTLGGTYPIDQANSAAERLRWFQAAVAAHPRNVVAHNNLGNALRDQGQVDEAIAAFRRAVDLDPKYPLAHINLGNALRARGRIDEAIAELNLAIALDPECAGAHYNLGVALIDNRQLDEAIAEFRWAIRLDRKHAKAHYNLGTALVEKGEWDEAITEFRETVRLDPKHPKAHNNLGVALYNRGRLDEAIVAYDRAIEIDPKNPSAHTNLGVIYLQQQKYPEAIGCARGAIAADPKFSNAHATLGLALQDSGDIPGARAALTDAARLDKRWAKLLTKLPPLHLAPPPREVKR